MLFIDLDLRRPVQSEMLGLSVKQKNELGTLLTESAAPEKILSAAVTDPATGLHSLLSTKSYTDVIDCWPRTSCQGGGSGPGAV